jgi:hypothetical protein
MPRDRGSKRIMGGRETRLGFSFLLALVFALDKSLKCFTDFRKKARQKTISNVILPKADIRAESVAFVH